MSKFCKNCGAELADTAAFCKECGSSVENNITADTAQVNEQVEASYASEEVAGDYTYEEPTAEETKPGFVVAINKFIDKIKNKDQKTILISGAIVLALIVCFVLAIVLPSGGGTEAALDDFVEVTFYGDVDLIENLAPEAYWEFVEDEYDIKIKDVKEYYEDKVFDALIDGLEDEYGEDIDVSYKIIETDSVSKSKFEKMKDTLKDKYDIPKKDIEDAVELKVELSIKGDDDKDSDETKFYAVQIDGDWYTCSSDGTFLVHEYVYATYKIEKAKDSVSDLNDLLG